MINLINTKTLKIIKLFGILFIIVVSFSSCYTIKPTATREVLQSYVGHPEQDVVMGFGPPTRIASDGSSGKILIYESERHGTINYPGLKRESPYYPKFSTTTTEISYINFFIDENDQVYYWRTNYPETERVRDHIKSILLTVGIMVPMSVLFVLSFGPLE